VASRSIPGRSRARRPDAPTRAAPAAGARLLRLAYRLRGSRALELLDELAAAPYARIDEIRAAQFAGVAALLRHAERVVPWYRTLFGQLGIRAEDIRSLEDFARLPVLTKDIVREHGAALVRDDVALASLVPGHTGGSTGIPLRFWRDRAYLDASEAATLRNFAQAGWRPGEMVAYFWGGNDRLYRMSRWEFELRQFLRRMYQFDPFRSGPRDMDRWLASWPRVAPTLAFGYASTIARFAAHIEERGVAVPPLRGVFTTAEKLFPGQREVIARVFGCRVFDCYGTSEVHHIAAECARGRMHVTADFVVLEGDHAGGPPASADVPFLVTSLRNFAMPFIRYRTEDRGRLSPAQCDCGNGFPVVELSVGRVSDNFPLPDGRVVHGEFFTHLLYGGTGIANFQFHQTDPSTIHLYVVPAASSARADRAVAAALAQLRALDPALAMHVHEVDEIPLSAAGKHRFTRSDVRAS
jgi:phenylacetate-CoA ligase